MAAHNLAQASLKHVYSEQASDANGEGLIIDRAARR
jgi:hypothetical protein